MASTARARKATQAVWVKLCAKLGARPDLRDFDPEFHIHFLEIFGQWYRQGKVSKSRQPVRAHTVETALGDVGAFFTDLGAPDPRMQPGSTKYLPALKKWLVALHKSDPASTRVYPCNVAILRAAFDIPRPTPGQRHARLLNLVGFFNMNRPGELLKSREKCRSQPFRLRDVELHKPPHRLLTFQAYDESTLNDVRRQDANASSLVYTDQKNCVKGEKITHNTTGDDILCPTRALELILIHLLEHNAPPETPLYTYYDSGLPKAVSPSMSTALLRKSALAVEAQTGIPPAKISSRSLRPGGATALLCAGHEPTNIQLVGRWRSEAMLRYLRAQATPAAQNFAQQMLTHGNFTYNPTGPAAGDADADEPFFGIPIQAQAVNHHDRFDPSDDASDLDDDLDDAPDES